MAEVYADREHYGFRPDDVFLQGARVHLRSGGAGVRSRSLTEHRWCC